MLVEGVDHVVEGEGAVRLALHETPSTRPGPRQQVGVVLDHRGYHHLIGRQPQAVGQVVYGFGGVATDHRHVPALTRPSRERQSGGPGLLVGGRGHPGLVARPRCTLAYHGKNSCTRCATTGKAFVEAAASKFRYGRR
jgi:hypothetical protein